MHSILTQFATLLMDAFGDTLLWGSAIDNYPIFSISLLITAIIVCINDKSLKSKFKYYELIIPLLIVLIIIGLIYTSLFIQWTSYGSSQIIGVQGRYFLPFLPLLFFIAGNFIKKNRYIKEQYLTKLVLFTSLFASYASLIEMIIKYI